MENSNFTWANIRRNESPSRPRIPKQKVPQKLESLHKDLLRKHYNAADVSIDYHRRRVKLAIGNGRCRL
ncbi:hypothetical protein Q2T40_03900 [Winogradskyella maritima]|nr:hypothetical protein [Winogradskyella maritima]